MARSMTPHAIDGTTNWTGISTYLAEIMNLMTNFCDANLFESALGVGLVDLHDPV